MEKLPSWLKVFFTPKMGAILSLGFSSGLPYVLVNDAFTAWMTKASFDLKTIGWFGLVTIPYSFKFVWAPLIDRFIPPFLGRRRGWMIISQIALFLSILALTAQIAYISKLSHSELSFSPLNLLAILAAIIVFLSATQDIAIDAYRTDVLEKHEVGTGASLTILGYRVAILLTGWIGFILADQITWVGVYTVMAFFMGIGLLATFFAPEPTHIAQPPQTLMEAVIKPFLEFFQRLGKKQALLALLFIILYRLGDAMVNKMAVPFLGGQGLEFSDTDIGNIRNGLGLVATIVGTLAGGSILSKIGINKSLWVFGIVQALSNLGYYSLTLTGKNLNMMILAINVENFSGGLGTAGFVGFLMSLCNSSFSATQFALLSSLMAVGRDIIGSPLAGEFAQKVQASPENLSGWGIFFIGTLVIALPGLLMLPIFAPWHKDSN
jgi:PAT family beta-lactamase induction signal transducer AmpG